MKKLIINCLTALFVCSASLFAQDKFPPDWLTKFESSNYLKTESYDETMQYFRALDAASDYASFFSCIYSVPQPQGITLKKNPKNIVLLSVELMVLLP